MKGPRSGETASPVQREVIPNIKRIRDVAELRASFRQNMLAGCGIDIQDPENARRKEIRTVVANLEELCRAVNEKIIWGIFGNEGELISWTEKRDVERLTTKDAKSLQALFLMGLKEQPSAFAANFENQRLERIVDIQNFIAQNYVMGIKFTHKDGRGKEKERLVAMGLLQKEKNQSPKKEKDKPLVDTSHIATLRMMYVHPAQRGSGLAAKMMFHALDRALSERIEKVKLVVTATNTAARRLYEAFGFRQYYYEDKAAIIDGDYYDWVYMQLNMDTYRKKHTEIRDTIQKSTQRTR